MSSKRKRSTKSREDILSSLESSDRKAAKLRKSQISTETLPRSFAAKSQVDIQTNLMECRILMQQALTALPNAQVVSDDEDTDSRLDELLAKLVNARRQLCFADDSDSDNETQSDSEDEDAQHDKLAKEYSKLRNNWKTTLNKHHANIHLQNQQNKNKFQVVDQSFWTQIESNVKHSAILDHAHMDTDNDDQTPSIGHDDSKLYQHMLKEYITLSAERGKDGAATAAAERLKRSMKKKN